MWQRTIQTFLKISGNRCDSPIWWQNILDMQCEKCWNITGNVNQPPPVAIHLIFITGTLALQYMNLKLDVIDFSVLMSLELAALCVM